MSLREKIENRFRCIGCDMPYCDIPCTDLQDTEIDVLLGYVLSEFEAIVESLDNKSFMNHTKAVLKDKIEEFKKQNGLD